MVGQTNILILKGVKVFFYFFGGGGMGNLYIQEARTPMFFLLGGRGGGKN